MNRSRWFVFWFVLAGAVFPVAAKAQSGPELDPLPLIDFRLKDQFDRLHTSGSYRNTVTVLVSGDRRGSTFIGQWSPALEDSLAPEVKSYRIKFIQHAHLKGVPFFVKGMVKDKFTQEGQTWVLMDWGGEFRRAYDLAEEHCSIVVFDRDGQRQIQEAVQQYDPVMFKSLLARIRSLIE